MAEKGKEKPAEMHSHGQGMTLALPQFSVACNPPDEAKKEGEGGNTLPVDHVP